MYDIRVKHLHPDACHFHLGHIEYDQEQRPSHLYNRADAKKASDDYGSRVKMQREYYFNAGFSLVQVRFIGLVSFRFDRILLPTFLVRDSLFPPGVPYLFATKKALRRVTQCTVNDS